MTLGHRIAEKRKAHKLSQEALGEKLGVSRQAIYKWESDSTLPEIEKLMALSRLFGVSVGWLLGMEEEENPAHTPELTPAQLEMAEEISRRYLAAASPAEPEKKRHHFKILSAIFVAALVLLFCRQGKLNRQYETLKSDYSSLSGQISSLQEQIANLSIPDTSGSENDLTASQDTTITNKDLSANTVTFVCTAVPKSYTEGMTAVFTASANGTVTEANAVLQGGQTFTAKLTCPLADNLSLSVSFSDASGRHTQVLATYDSLYSETMPTIELEDNGGLYGIHAKDGKVSLSRQSLLCRFTAPEAVSVYEDAPQSWYGEVKTIRVGLFRNQKLVKWAEESDTPPFGYQTSGSGAVLADAQEQWFVLPKSTLSVSKKDVITFAAIVTDTAGRTFVCPSASAYQLNREANMLESLSEYAMDSDVSHWKYE